MAALDAKLAVRPIHAPQCHTRARSSHPVRATRLHHCRLDAHPHHGRLRHCPSPIVAPWTPPPPSITPALTTGKPRPASEGAGPAGRACPHRCGVVGNPTYAYTYVNGNPINFTDPSGHGACFGYCGKAWKAAKQKWNEFENWADKKTDGRYSQAKKTVTKKVQQGYSAVKSTVVKTVVTAVASPSVASAAFNRWARERTDELLDALESAGTTMLDYISHNSEALQTMALGMAMIAGGAGLATAEIPLVACDATGVGALVCGAPTVAVAVGAAGLMGSGGMLLNEGAGNLERPPSSGSTSSTGGSVSKQESQIWKGTNSWRGQTRTNGLSGKKRQYYEWDHTHGDIEVYNSRGQHLGSMDPRTGEMIKGPVSGRTINVN